MLWLEYKDIPIESTANQAPNKQQRISSSDIDDYFRCGFAPAAIIDDNHDEYEEWLARGGHREDVTCTDPIAYWILKLNGGQYPRLARMALDLLSIPAMSSDPERIFSLTGLLLTANRTQVESDTIGATMALRSWDKEGVIDMVDGKLRRGENVASEEAGSK